MAVATAVLAGVLAGCTPAPVKPEPTPVFSSEAEAFAAAEETYRAYVDALNQVDLSDPETFEEVYAWTTGEANAGERKSLSRMHADGWTVSGATVIDELDPESFTPGGPILATLQVCTDISAIAVSDATGASVVSPVRPSKQAGVVTLSEDARSSTGMLVAAIEGGDHSCGQP
ncbi:MAG: hypothetical protein WBX17_10220 [Microbacterium sp.]